VVVFPQGVLVMEARAAELMRVMNRVSGKFMGGGV
jgi:hypothetical protein